jgi:thiol:disulfide interchange protein
MPQSERSRNSLRKQARPKQGLWWLGTVALVLLVVGGLAYFWTGRPASTTAEAASGPSPAAQVAPTPPVYSSKHIYSETADPKADIAKALAEAKREHKRVILDFGGDWCPDCQVLDIYFHQSPNAELLEKDFVLVHVWIGHEDAHLDVAAKYGVPVTKGVPALAVLGAEGKVLYAQSTGQFRDMRHMESDSVTEFLRRWKS